MPKVHSDGFYLTNLSNHLRWIINDYTAKNVIYGVPEKLFFKPKQTDAFRMKRYGQLLESPIGVAAGPQTQLTQNIVAAWLTGGRYIELKTIQVLDELEVTKPCIDMQDEGYNCEWSQELKLEQSFDEYLNAFIIIYILKDMLKIGSPNEAGFIFNMSAGYNLEGILSPTVQSFFDSMENSEKQLKAKIDEAAKIYPNVKNLKIPSRLSDSLTVSTMHGCPPDEIEKIGSYFLKERKYHTTIKLNPTLLGPEELRGILNGNLGYQTVVPDEAFGHDLKYPDGLKLINNLIAQAKELKLDFALKLTNTLETQNELQNLPKNEGMVYMSGRSLHCLSVNLVRKLQNEFKGALDVSFSSGADYKNITSLVACGVSPITVSSDALKPGGYGRLLQYLDVLAKDMSDHKAKSIDEYIKAKSGKSDVQEGALSFVNQYAKEILEDPRYQKEEYVFKNGVKTERYLPKFNCAKAPCVTSCAAGQDIPRYLNFTARGEFDLAYKTILATNPFPNVQGLVCDHKCQFKCTRLNYDSPLRIREIKRFIAHNYKGDANLKPSKPNGLTVAIVGAGPSGLSAAHFLAVAGFKVEMFEAKPFPGGMASDAIPSFRLDDASLKKDIDNILNLGVQLNCNSKVDSKKLEELRKKYDYVYLAIGAQLNKALKIPGEDTVGVFDQLDFLSMVRQNQKVELGSDVIVLGAGNSAIDVARAAKRLVGEKGKVTIVYRRTKREMPADPEEIKEAIEENIQIVELAAPETVVVKDGKVKALEVAKMALGEMDESGRAAPVKVEGKNYEISASSIIVAIGQDVDWISNKLQITNRNGETNYSNLFIGGDARVGASSLISAIADGQKLAQSIIDKAQVEENIPGAPVDDRIINRNDLRFSQARRTEGPLVTRKEAKDRLNFETFTQPYTEEEAKLEASRCLQCDLVCNVCVSVCPNRANMAVPGQKLSYPIQVARKRGQNKEVVIETSGRVDVTQAYQIVNIADFCNECGNCNFFCPTSGAPYKDKFKVHLSLKSLEDSQDGAHFISPTEMLIYYGGLKGVIKFNGKELTYADDYIEVELSSRTFEAKKVNLKGNRHAVDLTYIAEAAILWTLLRDQEPFIALDYYTEANA